MSGLTQTKGGFTVKAYAGDNKTLLAFNFADQSSANNLAGFSIQCQPPGQKAYYLWNTLQFPDPTKHAQLAGDPPQSSANAPFQKYRWVHVTGLAHQGTTPATGDYKYTVTPRYFDANGRMQPLNAAAGVSLTIPVGPVRKGSLSVGFTRGYMQSEAFARHFGATTPLVPKGRGLQFDTSATAGTNAQGQKCSFADIYDWMGASAALLVFNVLNQVLNTSNLTLSVFAYDLDEPDVVSILLKLAAQGRVRIILDDAPLHTNAAKSTMEDLFEIAFNKQKAGSADLKRGHFGRFAHDKVFIVSDRGTPVRLLTGSTNFSITGLYCNANHVLVFENSMVAAQYQQVFDSAWQLNCSATAFAASALATSPYKVTSPGVPRMSITFSPHSASDTTSILNEIVTRTAQETSAKGNVLFAVMQLTGGNNAVYDALNNAHNSATAFTYGISDSPAGTCLYKVGAPTGVLVTGKPSQVSLPPPFSTLPSPPGHEIHDKFVICGLNGADPVAWCGSSNLSSGGEQANGDNLLQIHDDDIATAFAIEALLLVDHYNFLDRYANTNSAAAGAVAAPSGATVAAKPAAAPGVAVAAKPAPPKAGQKAVAKAAPKAVPKAAPKKVPTVATAARPAAAVAKPRAKPVPHKTSSVKRAMAKKAARTGAGSTR